ncbi:MAG TPA: heme-copper oxidase subunit III [Acidimicrobiales bacterium]|nr:heme-copper oxidase subunit III [Acidimicrobiales bacterium]
MTDLTAALKEELVGHDHEHVTSTGISNEKLAMWVFLGSECLLFGGLISTFILYKTRAADGQTPHQLYDILFTSISSFVLLMSSLTMVLAVSAVQRADLRAMRGWLLTTALLGVVFISGQVYEFTEFLGEGYGFTHSPAWSAFYTLTGFHGVHVTLGIVMLLSTAALSLRGHVGSHNPESVEIVGLYWHFVDVVWVVIFTVVYLIK